MDTKTKNVKQYTLTVKELKEKLGIPKDEVVKSIELWSGLSPQQEEDGVSKDENVYSIITESGDLEVNTTEE